MTRWLKLMEICPVDRGGLEQATALKLADFEDAVPVASAISLGLEAIVTRDISGFAGSPIPILSSGELKDRLTGV